jgi:hypothetical protein
MRPFIIVRGSLGLLYSTFFSPALCFLAKQFQLYALSSRKNGGVVRAPKEALHELQFFVELLHGGVCGAEFVEQCQTPPKCCALAFYMRLTSALAHENIYTQCRVNLPPIPLSYF